MKEKPKRKSKKPEKGLFDKAKNLLGKADDFMDKKVKKVRKSKAFGTAKSTLKNVENFAEGALDDYKKSGTRKKIDKALDKAGKKAEKTYKEAKKVGKKIAKKAENRLDKITGNVKSKPKVAKAKPKAAKGPAKTVKAVPKADKTKPKAVKSKPKAPAKPAKPK